MEKSSIQESVKTYYTELKCTSDLKTNACCTSKAPKGEIAQVMPLIADEVVEKYYGCGITLPDCVKNLRILDLGSGAGRDCFIASKLVGPEGYVVGVDMTDAQLEVANRYIDYHCEKFGYKQVNVEFVKGDIEDLGALGFDEGSFDLVISNCVINLVADKEKVLKDVWKLLKFGGEMYFSDVYCDRRVPVALQKDEVLWGECLSGALYWNDFLHIARRAGFTDPRVFESSGIAPKNSALEEKIRDYTFFSVTYRLWKIEGLEHDCEDYGQSVVYKGTLPGAEDSFVLDDHHTFNAGESVRVCGNTYLMLHATRYAAYFEFEGSFDTHLGIFEGCGKAMPFQKKKTFDACCSGGACC